MCENVDVMLAPHTMWMWLRLLCLCCRRKTKQCRTLALACIFQSFSKLFTCSPSTTLSMRLFCYAAFYPLVPAAYNHRIKSKLLFSVHSIFHRKEVNEQVKRLQRCIVQLNVAVRESFRNQIATQVSINHSIFFYTLQFLMAWCIREYLVKVQRINLKR